MKSPFEKNNLLAGLAAGVMGAHPGPSDVTPHHQPIEQASSGYGKILDRIGSEKQEKTKELEGTIPAASLDKRLAPCGLTDKYQ